MGVMLESGAQRLTERGGPHFVSRQKAVPSLVDAGPGGCPASTDDDQLVGRIGETREERVKDLQGIARLHRRYGHIQEVIIQNFCAKPGTLMADAQDAALSELMWTIAQAR